MKTIGYGHACQPSSACNSISPPITQAEGLSLLNSDAARFFSCVDSAVTVPVNQNPPSFLSHPIGTLCILPFPLHISPSTHLLYPQHPLTSSLTRHSTPTPTQETTNLSYPDFNLQLTQNQFDALVSFAFNLGCGPIPKIANFINNSRYKAATDDMLLYVYGGGVVLPGLVRRRQAEVALFYTV